MARQKTEPAAQPDVQFGIDWSPFPSLRSGVQNCELNRRRICARDNIGDTPRHEHRRALIQAMWPQEEWHDWSERRVKSISYSNFVIWHGPASSAKSADAAKLAIEYWLESPHNTSVIVCSTTMQSLRRRIWAEVVSHFKQIEGKMGCYVGELLDASCIVRWEPGDSRHGIFGVAVEDGPVEDAVNNLVGFHPKRYFLILDEMQGVREAIMSHRLLSNITKNPEAKFLGMGNPSNLMSLLCRHAAPLDGGWSGIEKFKQSWEIDNHGFQGKGICLFFDGRKSPACLDPEFAARNPWMINQKMLDADLARAGGNENDPAFMEQSIGWPPEKGLESTVLDASILIQFKCQQKPIWTDGFTRCAALDPAFNGGDRAILQFGKRGFVSDGEGRRWIIGFDETIEVPIDAESPRPVHYQISDFVKGQCAARGIPASETAVLAAGEGGGLVSIMQMEWGPVVAIEEGGRPSDRIADERGKTAKEKYDTRASELCFGLRDFALGNGIRGLPDKAAQQACQRLTFERLGKWAAEAKSGSKGRKDAAGRAAKGFKERLGYSPDECFVAGTLIATKRGDVPIEQITMDDMVLTPFGYSPVHKIHQTMADRLTTLQFSDGSKLCGKSAHRIFVWEKGWTEMDAVSVDAETESVNTQPIWSFLERLFTRAERISFKALAGTIKTGIKPRRKDFFIAGYGQMLMGKFQKACSFITKTMTGPTTGWRIWNSWLLESIPSITCGNGFLRNQAWRNSEAISQPLDWQPRRGTHPRTAERGIDSMEGIAGWEESSKSTSVFDAENPSRAATLPRQSIAVRNAEVRIGWLGKLIALVACAEALLRQKFTQARGPVLVHAESSFTEKPVATWNLTLRYENAYYANGLLVENCDAVAGLIEHCRLKGAEPAFAMGSPKIDESWQKEVSVAAEIYSDEQYQQETDWKAEANGYQQYAWQ